MRAWSSRGGLRDSLLALSEELGVADSVDLIGYVDNALPYMAASDLLALSSLSEGMPTVLIEAMYCGTPVVSTDCPFGPYEALDGGRYGDLVPVSDPEAMAAAIVKNLRSPAVDKDTLKKRAMEFSDQRAGERYAELIESLMAF